MRSLRLGLTLALVPVSLAAQTPAITSADLTRLLFAFADDSMMGRETATPGHEKAIAFLEREIRRIGLEPAGENGTFFQTVPFVRRAIDSTSRLVADGRPLTMWGEIVPRDMGRGTRAFDGAPVVFGGWWGDTASLLAASDAAGKTVVLGLAPTRDGTSVWAGVNRLGIARRFATAAAVLVVGLDSAPPEDIAVFRQPGGIELPGDAAAVPAYFYVGERVGASLMGRPLAGLTAGTPGRSFGGTLRVVESPAPSRNVIGVIRGSDAALRGQYILLGAHSDHVGVRRTPVDHDSLRVFNAIVRPLGADSPTREPNAYELRRIAAELARMRATRAPRADSIFNGADDDGSGSVTLLEIAESLVRQGPRPKRSVLFVWHTGEEEGLLGSEWYADHPTVPLDSIVANLDVDMVGRGDLPGPANGPGVLTIIGARRISTELGDVLERVNARTQRPFYLDYHMDVDDHPEQVYCRSDNWSYNRYGIPSVSPMTGYHRDYHQVTDEPRYIDYDRMARVGLLLRDLTLELANLDHRLTTDRPRGDPRAPCRQ